jgi:hypothetical protein
MKVDHTTNHEFHKLQNKTIHKEDKQWFRTIRFLMKFNDLNIPKYFPTPRKDQWWHPTTDKEIHLSSKTNKQVVVAQLYCLYVSSSELLELPWPFCLGLLLLKEDLSQILNQFQIAVGDQKVPMD